MASHTSQIGFASLAARDNTAGDSGVPLDCIKLPFTVTLPFNVMPEPSIIIVPAFPRIFTCVVPVNLMFLLCCFNSFPALKTALRLV